MALVSKILEATLTAGSTTVTFTDSDIPNSLIRVFSSNSDIIPESRTLSGNTLTVTYAPQSNNIDVAVEIVKQGLDIVDNVLSEDTDKALSAKQGYLLSAAIGDVSDGLSTLTETVNNLDIPDNITDLDDVTVSDIQSGQVLAWDGTKFVNVNQSGGSGDDYSLNEEVIGTWLGATLYRKVLHDTVTPSGASYNKVIATLSDLGASEIISARGFVINTAVGGGYKMQVPSFVNSTNSSGIYISSDNNIRLYITGTYHEYYIVLEYTKTS